MPTLWRPDAPPASAGSEDDEFADASGGVPSGWTEVDHGTDLTVGEDEAGLSLTQTSTAGFHVAGVYKAIPAGDFTIWTKVALSTLATPAGSVSTGLALYEDATSSSGDIYTIHLVNDSAASYIQIIRWNAYNSLNSAPVTNVIAVDLWPTHLYLRVRRTSTTYAWDYSTDGIGWQRVLSGSLAITPAHFGPFVNNQNTTATVTARSQFFRYVASDVGTTGKVGGDRIDFAVPAAPVNHNSLLLLGVG